MKCVYKSGLTFLLFLFALFPIKLFYLAYSFSRPTVVFQNKNRAKIVDSEGNLLATSMKTYSVYYLPVEGVDSHKKVAKDLSRILKIKRSKIKRRLLVHSKFVWIARHITPQKANKISSLGYSGVYVTEDCIRFYPCGDLFFHILGKVDDENRGLIGVEKYYDEYLKNEKNVPLKLSLKSSFQHILKDELIKGRKKFNANFVSGLIVCAKTGKILAMFSKSNDEGFDNPHVLDAKKDMNIATQGRYEFGSIVKVLSAAMFLENKLVTNKTNIIVPPYYLIGKHKIKDYGFKHDDYLEMSFKDAFLFSSNVAFVSLAEKLDLDIQKNHYISLGLLNSWYLDKILIKSSIVPYNMRKCDYSVYSYGYGISSPLVSYVQAFLRVITGKNLSLHIEDNFTPDISESQDVFSFSTVKTIRYLLKKNLEKHEQKYNFNGVTVGGKTGTAKKHNKFGYEKNSNISSYVFVYPVEDPKIIGIVLLDDPRLDDIALFAGQSALFVALSIVQRLISLG